MLAQIWRSAHRANLRPGAARPWVALKAAFITEPQIQKRILLPGAEHVAEDLPLLFVLVQRPGARNLELVVLLVRIAHDDAVTQLGLQEFLDPSVKLDRSPVGLTCQRWLLD